MVPKIRIVTQIEDNSIMGNHVSAALTGVSEDNPLGNYGLEPEVEEYFVYGGTAASMMTASIILMRCGMYLYKHCKKSNDEVEANPDPDSTMEDPKDQQSAAEMGATGLSDARSPAKESKETLVDFSVGTGQDSTNTTDDESNTYQATPKRPCLAPSPTPLLQRIEYLDEKKSAIAVERLPTLQRVESTMDLTLYEEDSMASAQFLTVTEEDFQGDLESMARTPRITSTKLRNKRSGRVPEHSASPEY